jgi:hypothetical protein
MDDDDDYDFEELDAFVEQYQRAKPVRGAAAERPALVDARR